MALTTDRQKAAHLLRRFGLGASESELAFYLKDGLKGCIDLLLNYDNIPEGFAIPIESVANQKNANINPQGTSTWFTARLMTTQRPLQEKMTLFWHDHFATSGSKVLSGRMLHSQNEILRANAVGNFRTLLREVSKDPAMLFWLDNQYNVKGKPNENFAREVMELFTLGIGNYTEKDIQEGARAFTGWTIARPNGAQINADKGLKRGEAEFIFRPFQHDNGSKTYLGHDGNLNGDDVIDILCDMPRTAWYITWKIWEWFAYQGPDKALIDRLAAKFHKSNLNIKLLLHDVMSSEEFYSEKAERKVYKCPVDFCVTTMRQLGLGQMLATQSQNAGTDAGPRALGPAALARSKMKSMGMELLFPPDVAGWDGGSAWISTATMVERMGWADILFGGTVTAGKARVSLRYPAYGLLSSDPTPKGAVDKLVSVFDAQLPDSKIRVLVEAAQTESGGRITQQNAASVASAVSKLIFACPEFQFS